jgi:hypothetical protein
VASRKLDQIDSVYPRYLDKYIAPVEEIAELPKWELIVFALRYAKRP